MDPGTTFQTAVAAVAIIELITKILKRFDEYRQARQNVPQCLQTLSYQLPYLRQLFEKQARSCQLQSSTSNRIETDAVIQNCERALQRLERILDTLILRPEDTNIDKMKKAVVFTRKESKIKDIQAELDRQIAYLTFGSSIECQKALTNLCLGAGLANERKLQRGYDYGLPSTKVAKFIGRESLVQEVQACLIEPSDHRKVIVVYGMGGVGKTQLALEICERSQIRNSFSPIFWINASSDVTTAEAFENFAQELSQQENQFPDGQARISFVKATLDTLDEPYLLIFDNYDNPSKFKSLRRFFPRNRNVAILVTTRNTDSGFLGQAIEMTAMEPNEAVELLLHRTDQRCKDEHDTEESLNIVSRLGHLPLAIAQAGAFIRSRKFPLRDFLSYYNRRRSFILNHTPDTWEYGLNVYTTWEISMEQVSDQGLDRDDVNQMLTFCALLFQGNVEELSFDRLLFYAPVEMTWTDMFKSYETSESHKASKTDKLWDSDKFRDTISKLDKLSLVKMIGTGNSECNFSIHSMVCDWLKLRNDRISITKSLADAMVTLIIFMDVMDLQPQEGVLTGVNRDINIYILSCLHNLKDLKGLLSPKFSTSQILFDFKWRSATFLSSAGRYSLGAELYEEWLAAIGRNFNPQHPLFSTTTNNMGCNYANVRRYDDARKMFQRAIDAEFPPAFVNLGICFRQQGNLSEAQVILEQALTQYDEKSNLGHPDSCLCMANLIAVFQAQGREDKAEELLQQLSARLTRHHKEGTTIRTATYMAVGNIYLAMKLYDQSEYMFKLALDAVVPEFGAASHRAVEINLRIGDTYQIQQKFGNAETIFRDTFNLGENSDEPDHLPMLVLCYRFGKMLLFRREYEEAKKAFSRAFKGYKAMFGLTHYFTSSSLHRLLETVKCTKDQALGRALCEETMAFGRKTLGARHRATRTCAFEFGIMFLRLENLSESERFFQLSLDADQDNPDPRDPLLLDGMEFLAHCFRLQGKYAEGETVCRQWLSAMGNSPGFEIRRNNAMSALERCLIMQDKPWPDREWPKSGSNVF
jgi:tetratricopeptide (TPR) repeat protein